ncbi:MAG: hypothetical protein ACOC0A_02935 [Planctomycetota bacterium]
MDSSMTGLEMEILQVPDYLFADADYATTIRFRIPGFDGAELDIEKVKANFVVNGSPAFGQGLDLSGRTVGVEQDGTLKRLSQYDEKANGYIYECYVPSSAYSGIAVANDKTEDARFTIDVTIKQGQGESVVMSSETSGGHIGEYFIDETVPAVDFTRDDKTTRGDKRVIPQKARFFEGPYNRSEAVANYDVWYRWGRFQYHFDCYSASTDGDTPYWHRKQPQYHVIQEEDETFVLADNMFQHVFAAGSGTLTRTDFMIYRDTIDIYGDYKPIVCAKSLGGRVGARMYLSYGPADVPGGVLNDGEKAMNYDRNTGNVYMSIFDGVFLVEIKDWGDSSSFGNRLEAAGASVKNIIANNIPFGSTVVEAKKLFDNLNVIGDGREEAVTSAGSVQLRTEWEAFDAEGKGDPDKQIDIPRYKTDANLDISQNISNVNVGSVVAVYAILSSRFQQESHGYYDFWGFNERPELYAFGELQYSSDNPQDDRRHWYFRAEGHE